MENIDHLREGIARAPRARLDELAAQVWRTLAAGEITVAQAEALSASIELRRAIPKPAEPAPRRVGSRPRTPTSLDRRRRWAASGRLPPQIASTYSLAEQAVLSLVAAEVSRHGTCTMTTANIAAVVGVAYSTVRAALRHAREAGHITIMHRPRPGTRHDSNVLRVVDPRWTAWMRLSRRNSSYHGRDAGPPGVISAAGTPTNSKARTGNGSKSPSQRATDEASRVPDRLTQKRMRV